MMSNLLKGHVPLVITYWLFGVIPAIIYRLIGIIFEKYYSIIVAIPHIEWLFYLYLIVPFIYFPFIYVAIWRSSNHYTKNKLWPILAKISVVLGALFLILGIVYITQYFAHKNDINYQVSEDVRLSQKSLPIKISPEMELVQISFNKNTLSYVYQLNSKKKTDLNIPFFSSLMKPQLINIVCNNEGLKSYLLRGVIFSNTVLDHEHVEIYHINITPGDCH